MSFLSFPRQPIVIGSPLSLFYAGRLGVVGCTYLLRATFDADDQGFADGQVLDTDAEGMQDGQLTVVELDGTLAIVGNECVFTAQGTSAWAELGFYSQATARARGYTLFATNNRDQTNKTHLVLWQNAAGLVMNDRIYQVAFTSLATIGIRALDGVGGVLDDIPGTSAYASSTDYEIAMVLGGYDSNGVPWHNGAAGTFDYGCSFFVKGGALTTWTLLWRSVHMNTATMYAAFSNFDGSGGIDNFRVPNADLSAVLQPLVKDTFTDANGTSLDAHTPDVDTEGGGWALMKYKTTAAAPAAEIQNNTARITVDDTGAVIDIGVADAVSVVDWTPPVGVTSRNALVLRYKQDGDMWVYRVRESVNTVTIDEVVADVVTIRASDATAVMNQGTTYRLVAICDDEEITGFLSGGNRIVYAAAAGFKTETEFGIVRATGHSSTVLDNFHVHARRAAVYDTTLDLC